MAAPQLFQLVQNIERGVVISHVPIHFREFQPQQIIARQKRKQRLQDGDRLWETTLAPVDCRQKNCGVDSICTPGSGYAIERREESND